MRKTCSLPIPGETAHLALGFLLHAKDSSDVFVYLEVRAWGSCRVEWCSVKDRVTERISDLLWGVLTSAALCGVLSVIIEY